MSFVNDLGNVWWAWMWPMFWQSHLLIAAVMLADLGLRRWAWPQLRLALWSLILVKLILPPTLVSPFGWTLPTEPARHAVDSGATLPPTLTPGALAMLVWLGVVVLLGAGVLRQRRRARETFLRTTLAPTVALTSAAARAARTLGLRRVPRLARVPGLPSPAVLGWWRPTVLIPADLEERHSPEGVEHVLLHELAHIRRGDLAAHALWIGLQIAYWFLPLLWLARRRITTLREVCCDATVARHLCGPVAGYRRTLLRSARHLLDPAPEPGQPRFLSFLAHPSQILTRLVWLERAPARPSALRTMLVPVIAVVVGCLLVPMGPAVPDEPCSPREMSDRPGLSPVAPDPHAILSQLAARTIQKAAAGEKEGCMRLRYAMFYELSRTGQLAALESPEGEKRP